MLYRTLPPAVMVLVVMSLLNQPVFAHDEHEGTLVKAVDGKLTMVKKGEKEEHTHAVAPDAKITLDGKKAQLDDLKKGYDVTVTVHKEKIIEVKAHSHHHEDKK
jgi:hypothetical protein